MTMWQPGLERREGPRYLAIVQALAADVAEGRLPPGTQLPTHRELAEHLGVTVGTVSRAYAEAARRGLVDATVGRGTFVRSAQAPLVRLGMEPPDDPHTVDLGTACPPLHVYEAVLRESLADVAARESSAVLFGLPPEGGWPAHRATAAEWLAGRGVRVPPERVVSTVGGQQGLFIALNVLARHGEPVLVEPHTYSGVNVVADALGLKLVPVEMDGEGLLPEAVAAAARRTGARVVCCTPTVHNPTGATMSAARREALAETARRCDLHVVEDDVFGFLAPETTALSAYAPERSVLVASAGKSMAVELRAGFVAAPAAWVPHLAAAVRTTALMVTPATHAVTVRWIRDGTAGRLAAQYREIAAARVRLARDLLPAGRVQAHDAGFFVWLLLPEGWSEAAFVHHARQRGVALPAPHVFATGTADGRAARIAISRGTDEAVQRGLEILADLLRMPVPPQPMAV